MTAEFRPDEEEELLAAEYALRLLGGEELLAARGRMATDPGFAAAVASWEERLAPMLDEIAETAPPAGLWARIESSLGSDQGAAVIRFERSARRWRAVAAGASALAASLALVLALRIAQPEPPPAPAPAAPAPMMAAVLATEDGGAALAVAMEPDSGMLVVTPTRMTRAAGHDHELWLLPPSGNPISLGVVRAQAPQRIRLPAAAAGALSGEAKVALSVEPAGGSPTGLPTGPVVAAAPLIRI
jgi:anti-sigma-K factor RskA